MVDLDECDIPEIEVDDALFSSAQGPHLILIEELDGSWSEGLSISAISATSANNHIGPPEEGASQGRQGTPPKGQRPAPIVSTMSLEQRAARQATRSQVQPYRAVVTPTAVKVLTATAAPSPAAPSPAAPSPAAPSPAAPSPAAPVQAPAPASVSKWRGEGARYEAFCACLADAEAGVLWGAGAVRESKGFGLGEELAEMVQAQAQQPAARLLEGEEPSALIFWTDGGFWLSMRGPDWLGLLRFAPVKLGRALAALRERGL